jgi:hypothetical protein
MNGDDERSVLVVGDLESAIAKPAELNLSACQTLKSHEDHSNAVAEQ